MRNKIGYMAKGRSRMNEQFRQIHEEQVKREGIENKIPLQLKRFMSTTNNKQKEML